jgi:hypothetical protein
MTSAARSGAIFSRAAIYGVLTAVAAGGIVLVLGLSRPGTPTAPAAVALACIGVLALALVALEGKGGAIATVRIALLAIVGALAAPVGAFWGVNSAWAAVLALALTFAGLAAARPHLSATRGGLVLYATVAGGQLVVMILVTSRTIGDHSLLPVIVGDHPMWHHVLAHVGLQGLYLGAFVAGLALGRRHLLLRAEIEAATRDAATREALVEEARAEYARALEAVRRGAEPVVVSPELLRRASGRPPTDRSETESRPPPTPEPESETYP